MILDTSAWVELFEGTEKSQLIAKVIREKDCYTSMVSIAEAADWCLKKGLRNNLSSYLELIKTGSRLLQVDENISRAAGELNYERKKAGKKWGMMDSIIASTAQVYGLKILTADNSFRDLPDAIVLAP